MFFISALTIINIHVFLSFFVAVLNSVESIFRKLAVMHSIVTQIKKQHIYSPFVKQIILDDARIRSIAYAIICKLQYAETTVQVPCNV